jgi:hypothetical protein
MSFLNVYYLSNLSRSWLSSKELAMSGRRPTDEATWRGFSHDALVDAVSSDLVESGWVKTPAGLCDESSAHVQFAGNALLRSLFKKWRSESSQAEDNALLIFLEANHLSREWTLPSDFSFTGRFATVFGRIKWELDKLLHPNGIPAVTSFTDLWENGYTGPGASISASGQSFYAKFGSSTLSATSEDLYTTYRRFISGRALWTEAECLRLHENSVLNVVDSSNVSFAPKNADVARLICTEPSINMFLQLGLKRVLDERILRLWGVNMEDQPEINRLLARTGSSTQEFGTLDLSSASDSVSVELCRQILPQWFFELLMELRCRQCIVRSHGLRVDLGMISTMGNGFTFPVMTMILSSVVRAVYHELGIPIQDARRIVEHGRFLTAMPNWAVFGDDIIVRREAYDAVVEVLGLLGFAVNRSKSFNTGPFRESCGHDYFNGLNVRGVYLRKMASLQDLTVAVNLFVQWTAQTGICLPRTCRYLMSLYRANQPRYVPYAMPLDSGIRVPRELIPDFVRLTRKGKDWKYKLCFKAWTSVPARVRFGDGIVMVPSGCRRLGYNASALFLSLLLGEVRDGYISVRQSNTSVYRTQWHCTPNWDYVPPSYWFNHQGDWRRFQSAVYSNLFE